MTDLQRPDLAPILPEKDPERSKAIRLLTKSFFRKLLENGFNTFDVMRFFRMLVGRLLIKNWLADNGKPDAELLSEPDLISISSLKRADRRRAIQSAVDRLIVRLEAHGFKTVDVLEFIKWLSVYIARLFRKRIERKWKVRRLKSKGPN